VIVEQTMMPGNPLLWSLPGVMKSKNEDVDLVLVFAQRKQLIRIKLYDVLRKRYPRAEIVGCSTSGQINPRGVDDSGIHITALHWRKSRIKALSLAVPSMEASYSVGASVASTLSELPHLKGMLILGDGLKLNGSEFVRGIRSVTPDGVLTGGLAGDGFNFKESVVMHNESAGSGRVVAIGIYGEYPYVKTGYGAGWKPYGPPKIVTRSRKNVVYTLNDEKALFFYKMYIGEKHASDLPGSGLYVPFAVLNEDGSIKVIRTVASVNEADGSMTFFGDIEQGSKIAFARAIDDSLVESAGEAAAGLASDTIVDGDEFTLCVSCVGRRLVLEKNTRNEVLSVARNMPSAARISGFYSYGEICSVENDADEGLHNQTMTLARFGETALPDRG